MNKFFLFILFSGTVISQNLVIDTTYTIHSAYSKDKKKFPFITLAKASLHEDVLQKKEIIYKKFDSRILHLDAFYKETKNPNPALILIHGGGWKSGNKSQMEDLAIEIAATNYSCFTVEYRLSPEAQYPAAVLDIEDAIDYIKTNFKKFNVDDSKIAILGCSSGGQLAALVGTISSQKIKAIIDLDGILAFKHAESEEGKMASLWLGGDYEKIPQIWKEASALSHVDRNTPPVLFVNSDMPRFHAGRTDMIAILDKYKIYSEVKSIPNAPHSFWFYNPWFMDVLDYTVNFLNKTIKN